MVPAWAEDGRARSALELAQRALGAVGAGDGAQATVRAERAVLLRSSRSRATHATARDGLTVEIAVLRDGHVATASTTGTGAEALAACARAAEAAAQAAARAGGDGSYPGFPAPAPLRPHEGHDGETARTDPARGAAALDLASAVCERHGAEARCTWRAAELETAIASTSGMAVRDRVTRASMELTAIGAGGCSGYDAQAAVAAGAIEPAAVAERAALKASGVAVPAAAGGRPAAATAAAAPAPLEAGDYPVVLGHHAVAELLSWLGRCAFNGLAVAEGRSPLCGRLGTRIVAPAIALSDSPRFAGTLPRAFDAEGVPKAPLPLIQDGVAHRVVHDTASAAVAGAGASSTGHALAAGGAAGGPSPGNLVLVGGGAGDEAELCRPISRGVYITRLRHVDAEDAARGLFTGTTGHGTFLIEDGQVTRPLTDMRFADTLLGLLERAQALTARPRLTPAGVTCPAMRAGFLRLAPP